MRGNYKGHNYSKVLPPKITNPYIFLKLITLLVTADYSCNESRDSIMFCKIVLIVKKAKKLKQIIILLKFLIISCKINLFINEKVTMHCIEHQF